MIKSTYRIFEAASIEGNIIYAHFNAETILISSGKEVWHSMARSCKFSSIFDITQHKSYKAYNFLGNCVINPLHDNLRKNNQIWIFDVIDHLTQVDSSVAGLYY